MGSVYCVEHREEAVTLPFALNPFHDYNHSPFLCIRSSSPLASQRLTNTISGKLGLIMKTCGQIGLVCLKCKTELVICTHLKDSVVKTAGQLSTEHLNIQNGCFGD